MIVDTPIYDREKRIAIIPRLVRLCEVCGAQVVAMPPYGALACSSCKHPGEGHTLWENQAETFRRGLMEKEIEKAYYLASLMPDIGGAVQLAKKVGE